MIHILENSFEELVLMLVSESTNEVLERAKTFLASFGDAIEKLLSLKVVSRLKLSSQLGLLPYHSSFSSGNKIVLSYMRTSRLHSRYFHSLSVGAANAALACMLGFDSEATLTFVAAGIIHDIGHALFGHTGEIVLQQKFEGWRNHEEIGIKLIETDFWLSAWFTDNGVSREKVLDIVREFGEPGIYQRVTDTLMWWLVDSTASLFYSDRTLSRLPGVASRVLRSIKGCDDGRLIVDTISPLTLMVNGRAEMFRDFFLCETGSVSKACFHKMFIYSLDNELACQDDFYTDSIHEHDYCRTLLGKFSQQDDAIAMWLGDMFRVADTGCAFPDRWLVHRFSNTSGAEWYLNVGVSDRLRPFALHVVGRRGRELSKKYRVLFNGNAVEVSPSPSVLDMNAFDEDLVIIPRFLEH